MNQSKLERVKQEIECLNKACLVFVKNRPEWDNFRQTATKRFTLKMANSEEMEQLKTEARHAQSGVTMRRMTK